MIEPTNNEVIIALLQAMAQAIGRGGKKYVAQAVGISPSHLSKIFQRGSGFDDKSIRAATWMYSSQDKFFKHLPLVFESEVNPYVIRFRKHPDGSTILTFEVKSA